MSLEPFRLRVLKAVCATIKTVTPTNGYINDLADKIETINGQATVTAKVFRGRELFGDSDPLPMVSVLEHPRALDALLAPDGGQDRVGEWDLLIQGFVKDDKENPTDPAHVLAAEVVKALAAETERKLDGALSRGRNLFGLGYQEPCVFKMAIGSPIVRPADGVNSSQAFFWLTLTLTLVEDQEKPFAVPNLTL
ncbi:hypothetical protein AEAC466_04245 [Asticcacaulis sp. AC466]|uniref:hypothetical protein n=1 Tax=Asticcacaulis sp. AC466 TaxID=1282362 RepID=UPI0003C3DA89|nr:hypothetical protein [Asticcacaulis sp. AC466]ESQ85510.1 hypothetical protein AEAC466_04245 [Asticcacaulis sp. AC466]